ncbi:DNA-binding protein [Micromonospora sp. NPDC049102]|uniref:DNA-binding protein n=1 Tax=Micromonospora sp. NPDC049102 TaxID=3364265 RepID=UPI00370FAD35
MNEEDVKPSTDTLPKIGAPATRALHNAGYTTLRGLAGVPRKKLAALHGMGPKALDIIQAALEEHDLSLG